MNNSYSYQSRTAVQLYMCSQLVSVWQELISVVYMSV